jgi:uncharacterized lipoprotein YbaY
MRIEGEICFSKIYASFTNATISIKIENVSHADAVARVIFEHHLTGVSRSPDNHGPVPFVISFQETEPLSHCSLRIHVDVNATGEVTLGDYVSTQNYLLNNNSSPIHLQVIVYPVK